MGRSKQPARISKQLKLRTTIAVCGALTAAALAAGPAQAGFFDFLFGGPDKGPNPSVSSYAEPIGAGGAAAARAGKRPPERRQHRPRRRLLRAAVRRPAFSARAAHHQCDAGRDLPVDVSGEQDQGLFRQRNRALRRQGRRALRRSRHRLRLSQAARRQLHLQRQGRARARRRSICRAIRRCGRATSLRPNTASWPITATRTRRRLYAGLRAERRHATELGHLGNERAQPATMPMRSRTIRAPSRKPQSPRRRRSMSAPDARPVTDSAPDNSHVAVQKLGDRRRRSTATTSAPAIRCRTD